MRSSFSSSIKGKVCSNIFDWMSIVHWRWLYSRGSSCTDPVSIACIWMLISSLSLHLLNFDEKVIYNLVCIGPSRERWPQYNTISAPTRHDYLIKTMIWPFMNISEAVAFIINIPRRKEACSFFIQVMDMFGGNREDRGIIYSMWYEVFNEPAQV